MNTEPRAPLPWQTDTWERLQPLIKAGTLPHALLAAGPESIGKQHFLRSLAAALLCDQPSAGLACGICRACNLMRAGSHPDLLLVQPEEDSRVIKIDQVRQLIDFALKTPILAVRKLILLGQVEDFKAGIRRIHFYTPITRENVAEHFKIIRWEPVSEQETVATVLDYEDKRFADFAAMCDCQGSVKLYPMNLEDMFVELTRKSENHVELP